MYMKKQMVKYDMGSLWGDIDGSGVKNFIYRHRGYTKVSLGTRLIKSTKSFFYRFQRTLVERYSVHKIIYSCIVLDNHDG